MFSYFVMPMSATNDTDDLESKPWSSFYRETPGKIVYDESSEPFMHIMMALIFFAVGYFISTELPFDDPRDDIFVYCVRGIFPLLGGYFLFLGARARIRMRKFGTSTLTIKNARGVIGGTLSGTIQCSKEFQPKGPYRLSLACMERKVTEDGERTSKKAVTVWSDQKSVDSAQAHASAGIRVDFSIPKNLPPSTGWVYWTLKVSAPMPGVNYQASFTVPVF